jgi:transposase
MARAYGIDLRERVVAAVRSGATVPRVASRFGVSVSAVVKWSGRERATGSAAARPMGGKRRDVMAPVAEFVLARIAEEPSLTIRGLQAALAARGTPVSYGAVWAFQHRARLSFKKTSLASETERPAIARHRARWRRHQGRIDPRRLVFPDGEPANAIGSRERANGVKTNRALLRGWGPRRARRPGRYPHGHWRTLTFIAALRRDRLDAPCLFDGPINGEAVTARVTHSLVSTLSPGDPVILDNLGSHKGPTARAAIRAAGAQMLLLPPYSPDLNPVGQAFAKRKQAVRKAMARGQETVTAAIASSLETFSLTACANYLKNSGYASV